MASFNDLTLQQTGDNVYLTIDSGTSTSYKEAAVLFQHGSVTRFAIEKDNVANADLYIRRYNGSGVLQDSPLKIAGDTGAMTFASTGALTFSAASTPAVIDITNTATRAIRIGTKESAATSIAISSGAGLDAEPANNYLFGLFAKVAASEATSDDELRGAWIRTRVNSGCTIGTATGWGYGVCGAEVQLKIYGATVNSWQASALWAQLESQDATTTFASGCIASAVLANVGLTATTTIASGGVACGVCINSNTASSGVTATGGFYGLYITQKTAGLLDFTEAIHIDPACAKASIVTGNYASRNSADSGHTLTSVNEYNACFLADDSGDNIGASVRNVLGRTLLTVDQTGGSIRSVMGQLKLLDGVDTTSGVYTAVQGYVEFAGDHSVKTGSKTSGMDISVEIASTKTLTIDSGGLFAGLHIETTGAGTISNSGNCAAIYIDDGGTVTDWTVGVDIQNCTTGINVNGGTTGILATGTGGTASAKAISTSGFTLNNCNLTDGYGAVECELTLTGTVAGFANGLSSWINMGTVTTGSNYICAQTNGLWSDTGGVLSNSTLIFGMRAQCLCQTNGGVSSTTFYPFSVVNNTNITTALIQCNAASSDLGEVTDNGVDSGELVPLYKDGTRTGYVKIYTHT